MDFYRHELIKYCDGTLPSVKTFYNRLTEHKLQQESLALINTQSRHKAPLVEPLHSSPKHSIVNVYTIDAPQWAALQLMKE